MAIFGLLTGPIGNPFRVFHKKRKLVERLGTKDNYHLTWERQDLPDAGAGQYAWETYGLPPYARYGFGNIQVQKPLQATFPASYVFQSVGVVGNPPSSMVQGQFITQPLMDPDTAANMGVVLPGSVAAGPNYISNNGVALAP